MLDFCNLSGDFTPRAQLNTIREDYRVLQATRLRTLQKLAALHSVLGVTSTYASAQIVYPAQCEDCDALQERLNRIEGKLDMLIAGLLDPDSPPSWITASRNSLESSVREISQELARHGDSNNRLRESHQDLAEGADRFFASVRQKLTKTQADLFFELIASKEVNGIRRVSSYAEIGKRLGITKQAVQQQYRRMVESVPSLGEFVEAIRHPKIERNFSELSPTDRRKLGVDESYNYDAY